MKTMYHYTCNKEEGSKETAESAESMGTTQKIAGAMAITTGKGTVEADYRSSTTANSAREAEEVAGMRATFSVSTAER